MFIFFSSCCFVLVILTAIGGTLEVQDCSSDRCPEVLCVLHGSLPHDGGKPYVSPAQDLIPFDGFSRGDQELGST